MINALAPGKYTLTEERTPHTYDVAESIDFTVEKTGEIQIAVMYDKPISIKGEIDQAPGDRRPHASVYGG